MVLKAGKPTTAKERAIEAVKSTDDVTDTAKPKVKRFNVDIPATLHRDIKIQAAKEGVALNELTVRLFNEYLSKYSKE
jgi:predicted HicB family RNase H-like nuclease